MECKRSAYQKWLSVAHLKIDEEYARLRGWKKADSGVWCKGESEIHWQSEQWWRYYRGDRGWSYPTLRAAVEA